MMCFFKDVASCAFPVGFKIYGDIKKMIKRHNRLEGQWNKIK